jgi:hypothetical protein
MTRYFFIAVAAFFTFTTVRSQTTEINPVIGVNFSSLTTDPEEFDSEGRLGWHFGANLRIGDKFYFQPGLHYAQLNSSVTSLEDDQIDENSFESNIGVIRIPLLAGARLLSTEKKEDPFNINLHAGLAMEFVVDEENTLLTENSFTSPLFAIVVGAGVEILFLTLDIDYEIGLTPVFDTDIEFIENPTNNAFIISLGGKFEF